MVKGQNSVFLFLAVIFGNFFFLSITLAHYWMNFIKYFSSFLEVLPNECTFVLFLKYYIFNRYSCSALTGKRKTYCKHAEGITFHISYPGV